MSARRIRSRLTPYALVLPGWLWLVIFFVVPTVSMLSVSTMTGNDLDGFKQTFHVSTYKDAWTQYHTQIIRSLEYGLAATIICILIAYPVAYWITFRGGKYKSTLLFLLLLPFFVSFVIRTQSWQFMLDDHGMVLGLLRDLHLAGDNTQILQTSTAVVGGLVYNFLPFMVLPIYVALERVDPALLEASGDLYANKGDHKKAIMYLERAHSLEPANDNIVFFYSEQLHAIGALESELALLRDATKENPTSEQTWVMYLVALGTRRGPDSVLAELARVPAHDSTSLNWHAVMRGEAFWNKDLPDSAIATYRAALVRQPHSGNLHYLLANMLRQTGKLPEAAAELAITDSLKGARPEALLRMHSEIALARGDSAAARTAIAKAIRLAPLDSSLVVFQKTLGRAS